MSVHIIIYSFMVMERRQLDVCQCQQFIIHSRSFVPDNGSSNNSLVLHNCSKQSSTGHQSNITKRLNQNQIGILRIVFSPVTCCLCVVYSLKNGYPKMCTLCFVVMNIVLWDLYVFGCGSQHGGGETAAVPEGARTT